MPLILPFDGVSPIIHAIAFVAPNATIIGKVRIGADASVWYGTVIRGDTELIELGDGSNLQDNSVIHADAGVPVWVGRNVGIGHGAVIHSSTIEDGALIGMGARLLNGALVGAGALVAAGTVVLEGQVIPANSIAAGVPARVRGEISDPETRSRVGQNGIAYIDLARRHERIISP